MKTKKDFEFDLDSGVTRCFTTRGDKLYLGAAICHDDDRDMISEYTGCEIAETRANIEMLKDIRDSEIIPALKAIKHLQSCIETSKYFNKKSYESRMIRRQVCKLENDLERINNSIKSEKEFLKDYIAKKEKIYQRLRAKRETDNLD